MKVRIVVIVSALVLLLTIGASYAQTAAPGASPNADYSGMYTFLRDGEFLQLTVEDDGRLTGFVSRFGTLESDKGAFLDQFFKTASLTGGQLKFTTDVVHGTWYDFQGVLGRGEGKSRAEESYYVLRGKLVEHVADANQKDLTSSKEVVFKSFPEDAVLPSAKRQ
ncbi:MAG: hypothetical protein H0X25_13310 [Acidobacteriales bacterium]|nr:hypothetical protein [Terriglobales bacterium]